MITCNALSTFHRSLSLCIQSTFNLFKCVVAKLWKANKDL